jgi:CRP-like cAMP-binding protein
MIKKLLRNLFIDTTLKEDMLFLQKITLFHGLSKRALARIVLTIFKKTYFVGEKIYETCHEANVIYIIKKGQIKLTCKNSSKIFEDEDLFSEISLIENCNHNCSAIALKESELYLIYRAKFDDIIESDNKVGFIVMKNLASMFLARLKRIENVVKNMDEYGKTNEEIPEK